jgi:recombinational DNA repair protein (RecF pathway)
MSTFKTSGIVIQKSQINEKQEMFVIFSKEFGKITVFSKINKKEKMLDLGSIFNFEAQVKNEKSVTDMKNITLLYQFEYTSWNYEMLIEFMELLKILYDFCPK